MDEKKEEILKEDADQEKNIIKSMRKKRSKLSRHKKADLIELHTDRKTQRREENPDRNIETCLSKKTEAAKSIYKQRSSMVAVFIGGSLAE